MVVKDLLESFQSGDKERFAVTSFVFREAFSKLLLIQLVERCPTPPTRYAFASVNNTTKPTAELKPQES